MVWIKTESAAETTGLATVFAQTLNAQAPHPLIVALEGDLGSGKTTFVQGLARALGVKRRLLSPTFLLMRSYPLPKRLCGYRKLYHLDAYRFRRAGETKTITLQNILSEPSNIVLIEWANNIKGALPKNSITIQFAHGKEENERYVKVMGN